MSAFCLVVTLQESLAVDPSRYIPYDETPFKKYEPAVCDKFLKREKDIRYVQPSRERADQLLDKCPDILDFGEPRPPDDHSLFRADIDNDGIEDQVLLVTSVYSNMDPRSFFKVDDKTCKRTMIFGSYGPKRLFVLDGKTYIESTEVCRGPFRGRYLQCQLLYYATAGRELKEFQDTHCVYIEKEWRRFKGEKPSR